MNLFNKKNILTVLIAVFGLGAGLTDRALALSCQEVRLLAVSFVRHHFSYSEIDDELSKRTFQNLLKIWDPSKLYFLKSDIEKLEKNILQRLMIK